MKHKKMILFLAASLILALAAAMPAQQDQQQNSSQDQQQGTSQSQPQNQPSDQQSNPPKKSGGFFSGLKAASGHGSNEQQLTASAGTKGVGEGQKIADVNPTAADRAAVTRMEDYSIPSQDVKKFDEDGHLEPKQ